MQYSKRSNNLNKNEINHQPVLNFTTLTNPQSKIESKANGVPNCSFAEENNTSETGKSSRTTTTNSTASTDSGLNLIDNDDIPPHSTNSAYLKSLDTNTEASLCNKQFHKTNANINRDSNINNIEGNNCKLVINNNKNYTCNYNNDVDHNGENVINSENFDSKFKVANSREEGNSVQCEHKIKNVINFCQQRKFDALTSTETPSTQPISIKSNQHNDKSSLQNNEFIHLQQKPFLTTSMSSTVKNYNSNLSSNMFECKGSPVVSIRSINSTIITSDSDSDSDLSSDAENYVIKKLGTQLTYSPNDPAIPDISNTRTVLNQKVITNTNQTPLPPLEALAAIGDRIGEAQALGSAPLVSNVPQRPQIGSIALSNSNDVTFGDKHFYEGPVTIQQFLIDSRDKWKETNGKDNPTFAKEHSESPTNHAKDISSDADKSNNIYEYMLKRKKMIIPGVLAVTALLIVTTIWGSRMLIESKSKLELGNNEESRIIIPINSTIAQDNVGSGYVFRMVPRDGWLAQPPVNPRVKLKHPISRVIVIPTRTSECETQAACTYTVRITQTYNIESQQQDDIIYNFLIGGDGNIYEGRGWDNRGSVIKGFNDDSISFAFIGSFKKHSPSYKQLNVTQLLLKEGVRLNKLSQNYKIVGGNTLDPTAVATSADALYKSFENWPHWSDK